MELQRLRRLERTATPYPRSILRNYRVTSISTPASTTSGDTSYFTASQSLSSAHATTSPDTPSDDRLRQDFSGLNVDRTINEDAMTLNSDTMDDLVRAEQEASASASATATSPSVLESTVESEKRKPKKRKTSDDAQATRVRSSSTPDTAPLSSDVELEKTPEYFRRH